MTPHINNIPGDGTSSGLIGLAFPALTSAFAGINPSTDSGATQDVYNPIFTTMYTSGLVAPMFSLAIERATSGPAGYLALGGLPPVSFTNSFTSTPIQIITASLFNDSTIAPEYQFYTIVPQEFIYEGTSGRAASRSRADWAPTRRRPAADQFDMIVDSGTTLIYVPTELAYEINELFEPPAEYDADFGT
ncbi:MAG: pepsin-like aspartyl protease [Janthinobacterium lividum]